VTGERKRTLSTGSSSWESRVWGPNKWQSLSSPPLTEQTILPNSWLDTERLRESMVLLSNSSEFMGFKHTKRDCDHWHAMCPKKSMWATKSNVAWRQTLDVAYLCPQEFSCWKFASQCGNMEKQWRVPDVENSAKQLGHGGHCPS
jgi:hypothetical protein